MLQFLERFTGVTSPNITDWRRQTFGDLTSALGFSGGKATTFPPPLPATIGEFWEAEHEVETLPAATIPGATQTPPVQETRRRSAPVEASAAPFERDTARARTPATASRLKENRTTHAGRFHAATAATRSTWARSRRCRTGLGGRRHRYDFAYVPRIVGGTVAIFDTSTMTLVSRDHRRNDESLWAAATPDGSEVWVTESGTNTVSVIRTGGRPEQDHQHGRGRHLSARDRDHAGRQDGVRRQHRAEHRPRRLRDGLGRRRLERDGDRQGPGWRGSPGGDDFRDGSLAFVTCADGVFVIGTSNGHVSRVSERLRNPHGVAVTPDGGHAYITDSEQDRVVVVSTSSLRTVDRIGIGKTPWNTAFTADGSSAYVTNANDDTVSVIDTGARRVTKTIALGSGTTTDSKASFTQLNHIPTAAALSPEATSGWPATRRAPWSLSIPAARR